MREVSAVFQAAKPGVISREHLPQLPSWWPVIDPDKPLPDNDRQAARLVQAAKEARRGPMDGQRITVACPTDTSGAIHPPKLLRVFDSGWAYALDEHDSSPDWLVYRYSPADSPQHASTMAQVEAGYAEAGAAQTVAARLQQPETATMTGLDSYSEPDYHSALQVPGGTP